MSYPVYSEMLLQAQGAAGNFYSVVPLGQRWVVKHITVTTFAPAPSSCGVYVAGLCVAMAFFQGQFDFRQIPCMVVAYEGDQLRCNLDKANMYVTASGFAFNEAADARAIETHYLELGEELPPETALRPPAGA